MEHIAKLKAALNARFQMTDLGPLTNILGWQIERNRSCRSMFIHQTKYANKVIERFGSSLHPVVTPMEPSTKLTVEDCPKTPDLIQAMKLIPYRSCIGSFMYLTMGTRSDISFALQQLSQYIHNPGKPHWKAAQRVVAYLKGTSTFGLTLGGPDAMSNPVLEAYVDADYAACPDTRRCVSGYVTLLRGTLVSWLAKKQPLVTLSTTEAEYVALALCIQELLYLKALFTELGLEIPDKIPIHEDNQSCIKVATNPELHSRTKHIQVRYFFVKELVEEGIFDIVYCNSADQLGDLFTKALPKDKFVTFRSTFKMCSASTYLQGGR
jgi:hypothetical protein